MGLQGEEGELGLIFLELSEPILQDLDEAPVATILGVIRSVSVSSPQSPRKYKRQSLGN